MSEPTDAQRAANRKRAAAAHAAMLAGAEKRRASWPDTSAFERVIIGGGLAATLDWSTLPEQARGKACRAVTRAGDPWWCRGRWRMGQPGCELVSEGFVLQPLEFEPDDKGFAPASGISRAIALTAHERGFPVVFERGVQRRIEVSDDGTLVVRAGEHHVVARYVDVAVGLGPPRRLRDRNGERTIVSADEEQRLLADGRMIFGQDQWKHEVRGHRVLVYGGGATAAWNVEFARRAGAEVWWIARESPVPARFGSKARDIQQHLALHGAELPAERREWLQRTRARLLAFRAADLPRNRSIFADPLVVWELGEILSIRSSSHEVEVTLHRESGTDTLAFDQIVVSIGQDSEAPDASASLVADLPMTWLEHRQNGARPGDRRGAPSGRIVGACEDAESPRLRCLGAVLRSRGWWARLTRGLTGQTRDELEAQLVEQADAAPPYSRGIDGAVFQIGANTVLANGGSLDSRLDPERLELILSTYPSPMP